jgi:bifunctional NMN adenylyltransferase/nudix hydrolase
MKEEQKKYDIGVIIGRFQIHELHEAHKEMIDEVLSRHEKVIFFLGVSPTLSTKRNPLDFRSRKVMIEETYNKDMIILPINDKKRDDIWSKQVDEKIREVEPVGSVVLYGSRDSFIPHYEGKFDTIELVPNSIVSASQVRREVSKKVERTKEFRAGVIYGAYNNFATVHPVIDVAIMNGDETEVLLGRKKNERRFRFIGGFTDVTDESYEQTVRREAKEETGVEVDGIEYITSMRVEDWRYRSDPERAIITSFYKAKKVFGREEGNDDIEEVKWFKLADFGEDELVTEHNKLLIALKNNIKK